MKVAEPMSDGLPTALSPDQAVDRLETMHRTPRTSPTTWRCCGRRLADDRSLRRPARLQTIGDYVLAHAYLRDDQVLDEVLPPEIPVPALAEVQVALQRAAERVTGESGDELKQRLRTGTVVSPTTATGSCAIRRAPALQPVPGRGHRHGERHHRRPGLPLPHPLRHPAVRLGQAAARRDQAARPGQRLLRARHRRAPPHRHRRHGPVARGGLRCIHASCAASTNRRSGRNKLRVTNFEALALDYSLRTAPPEPPRSPATRRQ